MSAIQKHIAKDSQNNAVKMVISILEAIDGLKLTPNRNVVVAQARSKRPPVRSMPVWPYMVYFRTDVDQKTVTILRVRHGFRKPLRRFD